MPARRIAIIGAVAGGLLIAAAFAAPALRSTLDSQPAGRPGAAAPVDRAGGLDAAIRSAQARLVRLPGDWSTWAQLGSAYVQQARITADPTYYPKAQGALDRSFALRGDDNWQAMVGRGSLANARHDFTAALDWGRRAEQLNPYNGSVHGVITDALIQLGDYPGAHDAVQAMLNVAPGVSSFARASYDRELHGDVDGAQRALQQALDEAAEPADVAFCRYYLGELAFNRGDPAGALAHYQAALAADPAYQEAHGGLGKAYAALGRLEDSIVEYDQVVRALPLPALLIEYGDVLTAAGHPERAKQQYDLVTTEQELFAANGVTDHLLSATFLADHGDPTAALANAQAEWTARHTVHTADALAWALHRSGRDAEALDYADQANALGWASAGLSYHRGAIQAALGHRDEARADLTHALTVNPYFDVLQAPLAKQLLSTVEGPA
jgi:tetratricopeptide (TPR) repeat protein